MTGRPQTHTCQRDPRAMRRLSRRWWISEDSNVMVRAETELYGATMEGLQFGTRYRASFQDGKGWRILSNRFTTVEAAEAAANEAWSAIWA